MAPIRRRPASALAADDLVRLARLLGRRRALDAEALWPHVGRLAARIASFPPHAVAAARASVLRAGQALLTDLQPERRDS